jgi:alpha-L-fucosidase
MKRKIDSLIIVVIVLFALLANPLSAQYNIPKRIAWWYEARFGMFIHFGSYSYLGHGEWSYSVEKWTKTNYQANVSALFNPGNFNAGEIARLAKNAGMKYLVITAKHHEGFCMWKTHVSSFTDVTGTRIYDLPDFSHFGNRDILKELKDSCDSVGVKFCLYYSIIDWNHPSQKNGGFTTMLSMEARTAYILDMKAQLKELVERYHPAIMWFDGDWCANLDIQTLSDWWNKADGQDLYNYVIGLDSNIVINERVKRDLGLGDYACPEQTVPNAPLGRPWETCQTMNAAWGYNASLENTYKTPKEMIQELVKVVSRDGNYLLNIGPKGDGSVTPGSKNILKGFADWMNTYSESIYGTTRSPYTKEPSWGFYTKKSGKLYAHVFMWPSNSILIVPSLTKKIERIYLLHDTTTSLGYKDSSGIITIKVPSKAPNVINSVVVIVVDSIPVASQEHVKITEINLSSSNTQNLISALRGTLQIIATISPSNAENKNVLWSIAKADTAKASINQNGLVTAKADGKVVVYATHGWK